MESVLENGRNVSLALWALKKLTEHQDQVCQESDTTSDPPLMEVDKDVLIPTGGKVVTFSDPSHILSALSSLANDNGSPEALELQYEKTKRKLIDPVEISAWLMKIGKIKCMKWNSHIIYCHPQSEIGRKMIKIISNWVDERRDEFEEMKRNEVLSKIGEHYFRQAIQVATNTEKAMGVLKNMKDSKLVEVGSNGRLKYNFTNSFAILCFEFLIDQTEKSFEKNCSSSGTERAPLKYDSDLFQREIRNTNEMIRRRKELLMNSKSCESLEQEANIESALAGRGNRKRKSQHGVAVRYDSKRSRYSRSRSRSRSPGRRSRSSSPRRSRSRSPRRRSRSSSTSSSTSRQDDVSRDSSPLLEKLCNQMEHMDMEDLTCLPTDITYECALMMLILSRMGESKPKCEKSLLKVLEGTCSFFYFVPLHFDVPVGTNSQDSETSSTLEPIQTQSFNQKIKLSLHPRDFLKESVLNEPKPEHPRRDASLDTYGHSTGASDILKLSYECLTWAEDSAKDNFTIVVKSDMETLMGTTTKVQKMLSSLKRSETNHNADPAALSKKVRKSLIEICSEFQEFPIQECLDALKSCKLLRNATGNKLVVETKKLEALNNKRNQGRYIESLMCPAASQSKHSPYRSGYTGRAGRRGRGFKSRR